MHACRKLSLVRLICNEHCDAQIFEFFQEYNGRHIVSDGNGHVIQLQANRIRDDMTRKPNTK